MRMNRRNLILVGAVVLVAAGFLLVRQKSWDVANYPSRGTEIVAFGDSLVSGVGSESGGGFVTMLSKEIGMPIANLGRSGDTTADGLARIDEVLARDPKVVMVLLGGNDFLRGVPKEQTFANIDEIARLIEEKGAIVLLLGIQGGIFSDDYENRFEAVAKRRRTAYVSNVLDDVVFDRSLMSDSIHPNDKGYRIIADRILPELRKLVSP